MYLYVQWIFTLFESVQDTISYAVGDGMAPKNIDKDSAPNYYPNNTCNEICTSPCNQHIFSYGGEFLNCGEFI